MNLRPNFITQFECEDGLIDTQETALQGGFKPNCHTLTFVEVAKKEQEMALFPKNSERRQTQWGNSHPILGGDLWYANISADIDDLEVIENAKKIVDACCPQKKSTYFGGHYYSFQTREYLLNLLLFYYADHNEFPIGNVCIVDKWLWNIDIYRQAKGWVRSKIWRFLPREQSFQSGEWIRIPDLREI
jgi:hypothetical protein